jgi:hypothetical protein
MKNVILVLVALGSISAVAGEVAPYLKILLRRE